MVTSVSVTTMILLTIISFKLISVYGEYFPEWEFKIVDYKGRGFNHRDGPSTCKRNGYGDIDGSLNPGNVEAAMDVVLHFFKSYGEKSFFTFNFKFLSFYHCFFLIL